MLKKLGATFIVVAAITGASFVGHEKKNQHVPVLGFGLKVGEKAHVELEENVMGNPCDIEFNILPEVKAQEHQYHNLMAEFRAIAAQDDRRKIMHDTLSMRDKIYSAQVNCDLLQEEIPRPKFYSFRNRPACNVKGPSGFYVRGLKHEFMGVLSEQGSLADLYSYINAADTDNEMTYRHLMGETVCWVSTDVARFN